MSRPRSLVLITVDCLRADHVGFMGYARPTTPFLDSLASESIVLNNAIVAGAPTYDSFPAIMASRHPLAFGRDVIGLATEEPTIASVLNQIGYDTAAFIAGNPYLSRRFGYGAGFNHFHDFLDNSDERNGADPSTSQHRKPHQRLNHFLKQTSYKLGLSSFYDSLYFYYGQKVAARSPKSLDELRRFPSADVIVGRASEWLKQLGGNPFFLWLHLMDPHAPYYPSPDALALMEAKGMTAARARYLNSYWNQNFNSRRLRIHLEEVISLYDCGIRWVDQHIAGLVEVMRGLGLWKDCVFALTADHGEEFLDHGGRMHAPPKATEELVHVPLLLRLPGLSSQRIDAPFSLLDLGPTLLDCLQVPTPADFRGQSRWPQLKARQDWDGEAIVECIKGCSNPLRKADRQGVRLLAVREGHYKLIVDFESGADQFFDLEVDPKELHPLPREGAKPIRRRLLKRAHKHLAESTSNCDSHARVALLLRDIIFERGPA